MRGTGTNALHLHVSRHEKYVPIKLMRLGSPNQIDIVKSNLKSEFDCQIMLIRISTIKIESTIANLMQNRSIFDIMIKIDLNRSFLIGYRLKD